MKHSNRKDWLRLINSIDGKDRSKSRQPKKNKKPCRSKTPARHDNKTDYVISIAQKG